VVWRLEPYFSLWSPLARNNVLFVASFFPRTHGVHFHPLKQSDRYDIHEICPLRPRPLVLFIKKDLPARCPNPVAQNRNRLPPIGSAQTLYQDFTPPVMTPLSEAFFLVSTLEIPFSPRRTPFLIVIPALGKWMSSEAPTKTSDDFSGTEFLFPSSETNLDWFRTPFVMFF